MAQAKGDAHETRAASLLSTYLRDGATRTDLLREMAHDIYALRMEHQLKDGKPDLAGRSAPYRAAMARIYDAAHLPAEDKIRDRVQTALRYHVQNLIHEKHTAEEIADAGLAQVSPKSRRDADREVYTAFTSKLTEVDPGRYAARAVVLLRAITPEAVEGLDYVPARAAREVLEAAIVAATAAAEAIDARHPSRKRGGGAARKRA